MHTADFWRICQDLNKANTVEDKNKHFASLLRAASRRCPIARAAKRVLQEHFDAAFEKKA